MGKVMFAYDTLVAFDPERIIALTFAIVLAAILIVGRRRQRRLYAKLDQMSARITALEVAENQRLMMRVNSASEISDQGCETVGSAS